MTPYDTHATTGPFARSISAFESLMHTLSGGDASERTHAELEEHLDAGGRNRHGNCCRTTLTYVPGGKRNRSCASGRPVVMGPEGQLRPRRRRGTHAGWPACSGRPGVTRVAHRGPGVCIHPTDAALSLPGGRALDGPAPTRGHRISARACSTKPSRQSSVAAGRCWANADSKMGAQAAVDADD